MPAPKMPSQPPAKKTRVRDGHADCYKYLGEVGALMFYTYGALRYEASGVELLKWTQRLQKALLSQPEMFRPKRKAELADQEPFKDMTVEKPQISLWKQARPIAGEANGDGKAYNVRVVGLRVDGLDEKDLPTWAGHLLLIYDTLTDTLVHHFYAFNKNEHQLSTSALLYGLQQGLNKIETRRINDNQQAEIYSIEINGLGDGKEAYDKVAELLRQALATGWPIPFRWQQVEDDLSLAKDDELASTSDNSVFMQTYYPTSRRFSNALARTAKAFNRVKHVEGEKASSSAWISLSPIKASEKKDPNRIYYRKSQTVA
jgi:hypothetical protein